MCLNYIFSKNIVWWDTNIIESFKLLKNDVLENDIVVELGKDNITLLVIEIK